ncbi:glycosyltransferase [Leptospira sp. GIMC2001]|uniref:glycosyltransferase n=1 Tax=Leptospira sp. GIMC2001 TaxID=1513297 RepID=UPI00234A823E|nr:glycosyltransferase [Leptospira sp. GIMC2001]WCL51246.1 glycosyltransferase [Leptospira sp. GIMC2001]
MNSSILSNNDQLNILHIVNDRWLLGGGVGSVAYEMFKTQRNLGNNTAIWSIDSTNKYKIATNENTLEKQSGLKVFKTLGPKSLGFSPAMERAAVNEIGGEYEILHQHSIWFAVSRVTNNWRIKFDRPTIITPHGTLEDFSLNRSSWKKKIALAFYEMKNLKSATCLQATAEEEALSFRRFALKNPIAIIPNGVSEDWLQSAGDMNKFRERYSILPSQRVLLFISRIHPKKGLPMLLDAMSQLPKRLEDWILVIAGPDESGHQHDLRRQSGELGLTNRVIFVGPLYGSEKRDALAAADLFVLPTHSENFGIVIAEALGAGIPVITTRGTPWESLQSHNCGWWVDVSTEAIRDALIDATQLPKEELVIMGRRGRLLMLEKYTWTKVAKQSLELYNWLLGRASRPNFVFID